jgi:hypothetical protein
MTDQPDVSPELLQKNAEQLARLEPDWSELGPRRQIDYHCRFPDRERAEAFCVKAQEAGFETRLCYSGGSGDQVTASVRIEPTALKITQLQEQLESFLEDADGWEPSCVDGWSYPPKRNIHFWPSSDNRNAVEARAAVLFGSELVEDPLAPRRLPFQETNQARPVFGLVPSEFLRKARAMQPVDPQPTASAFAQWVYSLYGRAEGGEEDVADGKAAEQDIWERRRGAASCNDNRFLRAAGWHWSLVHNGLDLRDRDRSNHFLVPSLRVNGEPLRASPDLVYANADKSEVMIVEIKFSRQALPKNLWPNVWAQLWCYAQLEMVRSARKLTVVGEVWGENWTRGYRVRGGREPGKALVCLRALVRRDPRASSYDRFFRQLFNIYTGS